MPTGFWNNRESNEYSFLLKFSGKINQEELLNRSTAYQPQIELTKKGELLVAELIPKWEILMDTLTDKLGIENIGNIERFEQKMA